jgi:hypothetical protein
VHRVATPLSSALTFAAAAAAGLSCSRAAQVTSEPVPQLQPLATYLQQRVIVTPAGHVRADSLGWVQQAGGARIVARQLDTALAKVLEERGVAQRWIMPAELVRSFERNRSYATDPYQLAVEPLRPASFVALSRYGEPLSTQLRTMIALHESARFVLLPVELRFERSGTAAGRAVLRATIVDPRFAEARWVGEIPGDPATTPAGALASVAARFADKFLAP